MNIEKTVPCRDGGREYRMVNFLFCMLGYGGGGGSLNISTMNF